MCENMCDIRERRERAKKKCAAKFSKSFSHGMLQ